MLMDRCCDCKYWDRENTSFNTCKGPGMHDIKTYHNSCCMNFQKPDYRDEVDRAAKALEAKAGNPYENLVKEIERIKPVVNLPQQEAEETQEIQMDLTDRKLIRFHVGDRIQLVRKQIYEIVELRRDQKMPFFVKMVKTQNNSGVDEFTQYVNMDDWNVQKVYWE